MKRQLLSVFAAFFALLGSASAQGGYSGAGSQYYGGGDTFYPVFGNPRVYANVEQMILQELNDIRAERGLPPLLIHPDLKEVARGSALARARGRDRGFGDVRGDVFVEGARVEMTRRFARGPQQAREAVRQLLQDATFQRVLLSRGALYVGVGVARDLPGEGILFAEVALSDQGGSECFGAGGFGGLEEPFYPGPGYRNDLASRGFGGVEGGRLDPSDYGLRQDESLAREILAEINAIRTERGLPPLQNDPGLARAATFRAVDISTGSTQGCNLGSFDLDTRLRLMGLPSSGVSWEGATSFPMDRPRATEGAQFAQTLEDFFQSEATRRFLLSGRVRFAGVSVAITPEGYVTAVISTSSQPSGARGGVYDGRDDLYDFYDDGFGGREDCRQVTTVNEFGQRVTRWVCPR